MWSAGGRPSSVFLGGDLGGKVRAKEGERDSTGL
jgi:hypothetical protein